MSTTVQKPVPASGRGTQAPVRGEIAILAVLVLAGGALRAATISAQSFWDDELWTVWVVHRSPGDALTGIAHTQALPYLYFLIAWPWAHLFGSGEAGLRSLSVLMGTAAIPIAWAWCRGRAGLAAAAVVALNPFLVWYGQEARPYALLVPLAAVSVLLVLRGRVWWWALVAGLMAWTHYFAVFLLLPEALWLLRAQGRRMAGPLAAVAAAGLTAVPLLVTQLRHIADPGGLDGLTLTNRLAAVPKNFLVAYNGPLELPFTVATGLLGLGAIGLALTRAEPEARRLAAVGAAIALAAVAIPTVAALAGSDYVASRNLLAAMLPGALAVGAGIAAGRAGLVVGAALGAIWLVINVGIALDPGYQRLDWRGAAAAVGPPAPARIIVFSPGCSHLGPCSQKFRGVRHLPPGGARGQEIAVISLATEGIQGTGARHPPAPAPAAGPPPGFRLVERRSAETYTLLRYRSDAVQQVDERALSRMRLGTAPVAVLRY